MNKLIVVSIMILALSACSLFENGEVGVESDDDNQWRISCVKSFSNGEKIDDYRYSDNGKLIEREGFVFTYSSGRVHAVNDHGYTLTYDYDDEGKMIGYSSGNYNYSYRYNDGKLVEYIAYDTDNTVRLRRLYEYDSGRLVVMRSGDNVRHYKYNGNVVRTVNIYKGDTSVIYQEYFYNDDGRLTESYDYYYGPDNEPISAYYGYDENGNNNTWSNEQGKVKRIYEYENLPGNTSQFDLPEQNIVKGLMR